MRPFSKEIKDPPGVRTMSLQNSAANKLASTTRSPPHVVHLQQRTTARKKRVVALKKQADALSSSEPSREERETLTSCRHCGVLHVRPASLVRSGAYVAGTCSRCSGYENGGEQMF